MIKRSAKNQMRQQFQYEGASIKDRVKLKSF
jgi:hypothetical protein